MSHAADPTRCKSYRCGRDAVAHGACSIHADDALASDVRAHLEAERMTETCEPEEALFSLVRYFGQRGLCGVTKARGSTRAIELHRGEARCSIVAQLQGEAYALVIKPGGVTWP